jgi:outer membrane autotransporter protein
VIADLVTVSGSANIAGVITVQPSVLAEHAPIAILTAGDGVSLHASVSTPMTAQSTVFSFATKVDGNSLQIQPTADFTTPAAPLGAAQQAVAAHLQEIWNSGSSMSGGFTTLAGVRDPAVYATDLNSLSGQTLGAIAAVRYQSSQDFVANLYGGCPDADTSGSKSGDSCGWARITDSHSRRDMTSDVLGYSANAQSIQFGTQNEVARNLFIGGLVAYEMSDLHGDEHSSDVDGKSAVAGATVRYLTGHWQFMGAIDANHGWYDTTRHVSVGTLSATASASPTMWSTGLHARIAYDMPQGNWYAKPFVNLHAIYLASNSYTESGAGAFDLAVARETDVALAGGAGMELGGNINLGKSASLHPFVSASGEYLGNSDWAARARFADQPASRGFRTSTPLPNALAKIAVGADLVSGAKWDVRLQFSPDFGKDYFSEMGELKFDLRF